MTGQPEDRKHTIEVFGEHEEDLLAHAVDLFVAIEGSSFFTGRAALTKAKEVSALVQALGQEGVPDSSIDLTSVRVEVKSGLLSKSSSALYQLRVRVTNLELLPAALGCVAAAKQASLERLQWQYPEDDATESRLLAAAASRGAAKARAIAAALGTSLAGLAEAKEIRQGAAHEDDVEDLGVRAGMAAMRRRAPEAADMGLQVQHRRKVKREVRLVYLVAPQA